MIRTIARLAWALVQWLPGAPQRYQPRVKPAGLHSVQVTLTVDTSAVNNALNLARRELAAAHAGAALFERPGSGSRIDPALDSMYAETHLVSTAVRPAEFTPRLGIYDPPEQELNEATRMLGREMSRQLDADVHRALFGSSYHNPTPPPD